MTDIIFGYPCLTTVIDASVPYPIGIAIPPIPGDGILQIDNSSLILLIDGTTNLQTGY